jgi:hypothetical protein
MASFGGMEIQSDLKCQLAVENDKIKLAVQDGQIPGVKPSEKLEINRTY